MPAEECDNGMWKWGETGECKYETQEEAEEDNEDDNEYSEIMEIDKRHIISVQKMMTLILSFMKRIEMRMKQRKLLKKEI